MFTSSQQFFPSIGLDESITKNISRPESPQRSRFTKEEDQLLKMLVGSQSQPKWSEIAANFQNRTARQCRERYNNYLRPDLKNGPWSKEEDDLLIELYSKHGPKWSLISQSFNSRSSVNVKNHHSSLLNQLTKTNSPTFKIEIIKHETKTMVENDAVKINENFKIEETIKIEEKTPEPVQNLNEDDYSISEDENFAFVDDSFFQNLFSNLQYEDEMWSNSLQAPEEDNIFAF